MAGRAANSLETILTYENRDLSQWSVQWSTGQIPGMDNASGRPRLRKIGRRRLRIGSLVLGGLLTMHCRVAAAALTGGLFVFLLLLIVSVVLLANPMRHFEVYLGQWSISGPGRAFRIIPMLDGIGIAICINAIVRAIYCCFIAAIALLYVIHSISDAELPFTYCRNFSLNSYTPTVKELPRMMTEFDFFMEPGMATDDKKHVNNNMFSTTVGLFPRAWRNGSSSDKNYSLREGYGPKLKLNQIAFCKEKYIGRYPVPHDTPAYNFFYVEAVHYREDHKISKFNVNLFICNVMIWGIIWALMISERFRYGKMVWNNICMWLVIIPFIWAVVLSVAAISSLFAMRKTTKKVFRSGPKELLAAIADSLEVALYIHSASIGTEIVHGKGLNHYASGHVDPHLNAENVWHSVLLLLASGVHCFGAALCGLVDSNDMKKTIRLGESTLWILPLYSKCTAMGNYSHFMTTLVFGGLVFSYVAVAFILLKTALHIIFEYKVKLVFVEQIIVAALMLTCIGLSLPFAFNDGIALLESVDALMSGVVMALVCLLELFGLLFVYRSHDFVSDMNLSMEDAACPTRIDWQWQMIPFVTLITIFLKGFTLSKAEMPATSMYMALAPVVGVCLAVPLRAIHNAVVFMRPSPRHGT